MNLNNSMPVPVSLRLCFWHPEYIAAQPFCATSKLTAEELISLAAFEELKFWERTEQLKSELSAQSKNELVETLDEILNDDRGIDFNLVTAHLEQMRLESITSNLGYDIVTKIDNLTMDFHQKDDNLTPNFRTKDDNLTPQLKQKTALTRSDFLTR